MKKLLYITLVLLLILTAACEREGTTEPIDDGRAPSMPAGINVYGARDGEVGIEWRRNTEPDISGYNIYRSISDTSNPVKVGFTSVDFFVDDSLEYDSTYYYRITAIDNSGNESIFSLPVSATPTNIYTPLRPQGVVINARNWNDSLSVVLSWVPSGETDIAGYEIYRDTLSNFTPDSSNLHSFTTEPVYTDTKNVELLKDYYYTILTVDKGGLKSSKSTIVNDVIIDEPLIIFPGDDAREKVFNEVRFVTSSRPAKYKLVIQSNEIHGIIEEVDFATNKVKEEAAVKFNTLNLELYRKYYWRLLVYTENNDDPNTFTSIRTFTFIE